MNQNGTRDLVSFYQAWGHVVFVPVPTGKKECYEKGWPTLTYEQTLAPEYQAKLQNGNLAILTGPASENIVSIDCDSAEGRSLWVDANGPIIDTRQIITTRGGRFYYHIDGPYPACHCDFGNGFGEWHGKSLNVIDGTRKDGLPYKKVDLPIKKVRFDQFAWPGKFKRPEFDPLEDQEQPKLEILRLEDLPASPPPVVFDGLLRVGQVLLMGGHSKKWKSYALRDMFYCAANQIPWLIFEPANPNNVVDIDLECESWDLRKRYQEIRDSYGMGDFSHLRIVPMRGKTLSLSDLALLPEQLRAFDFNPSLIGLEPIYRLLTKANENDTGVVTEMMNSFLTIGTQLHSSIASSHHFSKGPQADKDAIERFSGTGVWGRHPDALVTFTQHAKEDCFTVNLELRSFPRPEPFVVHWQYPRFYIQKDADPEDLKRPPIGRKPKSSAWDICALVPRDNTVTYTDWQKRAEIHLGLKRKTFDRRLKVAKEQDLIYHTPTEEYGVTVKFLKNLP